MSYCSRSTPNPCVSLCSSKLLRLCPTVILMKMNTHFRAWLIVKNKQHNTSGLLARHSFRVTTLGPQLLFLFLFASNTEISFHEGEPRDWNEELWNNLEQELDHGPSPATDFLLSEGSFLKMKNRPRCFPPSLLGIKKTHSCALLRNLLSELSRLTPQGLGGSGAGPVAPLLHL